MVEVQDPVMQTPLFLSGILTIVDIIPSMQVRGSEICCPSSLRVARH